MSSNEWVRVIAITNSSRAPKKFVVEPHAEPYEIPAGETYCVEALGTVPSSTELGLREGSFDVWCMADTRVVTKEGRLIPPRFDLEIP